MLGLLGILAVWGVVSAGVSPVERDEPEPGRSDNDFYALVVDEMREGRGYYEVIDAEQADFGFPTTPVVTVREPTLAWFVSTTAPAVSSMVMIGLAVVAGGLALRTFDLTERSRRMWVALTLVAACGLALFTDPAWRAVHETWAMLLVFIGLFALRFGHGRPSMMVILVASMVRELVAPIMPILAVVAWRAGRRREAVEWLAVTGMFSAFYFWHAWQVSRDVAPGALESPGWLTWRGWPGAVDAFGSSTVLTLVNPGVASAVLLLGLLGWTMRRGVVFDPIAAVVLFYTVLLCVAGRDDTWYWGYYVGGIVVVGVPMGVAAVMAMLSPPGEPRCTTGDRAS
ncbi:hypothetical protein [Aeromicrobium sp.]|uniref:hypothetical protein n=1 Tax=Aeromicrobium sp. TaxID=1871063 RepID=UPI002617C286|nr:hypothetical protein [Aeromicrobium sp.]